MKKKQYQQPITDSIFMEPRSILCVSAVGAYIDPNPENGMWGG